MDFLISTIIGYSFGSFPTAYLLVKKIKGNDVTKEGSGNVGTLNSYEITKSKTIAALVLLIDFTKGFLSAFIPFLLFPDQFIYPALAVLFAVLSHCYSPWISFNGGRGLATAAGGAVLIFPFLLVVWCLLWVILFLMRKNILFANIGATILSLLLVFATSDIAYKYASPKPDSVGVLLLITASVMIIIFIKHIEPLKELISNRNRKKN